MKKITINELRSIIKQVIKEETNKVLEEQENPTEFNINKVWDFIESRPFYNKNYMPKFKTAKELWGEWGSEEKQMYAEFDWKDTYAGKLHQRELQNLQRRKTYDHLAGLTESKNGEFIMKASTLGLSGIKNFAKKYNLPFKTKNSGGRVPYVYLTKDGKEFGPFDPTITTKNFLLKKLQLDESLKESN